MNANRTATRDISPLYCRAVRMYTRYSCRRTICTHFTSAKGRKRLRRFQIIFFVLFVYERFACERAYRRVLSKRTVWRRYVATRDRRTSRYSTSSKPTRRSCESPRLWGRDFVQFPLRTPLLQSDCKFCVRFIHFFTISRRLL